MKKLLFYSLLLLFIIATQSSLSVMAANIDSTAVVYDTDGEKVRQLTNYSLGPVVWAEGGLKVAKETCPFNVIQDPLGKGGLFQISMIAPKEKIYVREEYPLCIHSGFAEDQCRRTTFWQIEDDLAKPPSNFVTTGAPFDEGESCFQIVKFPKPVNRKVKSYLLQHCPYVCGGGPPYTCYNVSIYIENGIRHLASRGTPFEFVIRKES